MLDLYPPPPTQPPRSSPLHQLPGSDWSFLPSFPPSPLPSAENTPSSAPEGLSRCRIDTPPDIVDCHWRITRRYRQHFGRVLDLAAGDGRYAKAGSYDFYYGLELDPERSAKSNVPENAHLHTGCGILSKVAGADLCIGNPPYIRHHYLDEAWKAAARSFASSTLHTAAVDGRWNAYLYFLLKALVATKADGLVSMLVPFEWVTRPAAASLRAFIRRSCWNVDTYRFRIPIFNGVLTTAALTVIDKARAEGRWRFFELDSALSKPQLVDHPCGSNEPVLAYSQRHHDLYAQRGLSPGCQPAFVLSECQRHQHALQIGEDVLPCITTLRHVPSTLERLDAEAFNFYFVKPGVPCWLIRSVEHPGPQLQQYLESVPESLRQTATCKARKQWWRYHPFPVPLALFSSAFTGSAPKVLVNELDAVPVGSVCGIHGSPRCGLPALISALRSLDLRSRLVPHAKTLVKVEINQMNTLLAELDRPNRDAQAS